MNIKPFGKVSIQEIRDYSSIIDFQMPEIYSYFLTQTNGGIVEEPLSFSLPNESDVIVLEKFYGFGLPAENDIVAINNQFRNELPPNSLIIGSGFNGYFVLVNKATDSLFYFWDINKNLDISNEDANAYLISDSFENYWNELGEIYIYNKGEIIMEKTPYVPLGSIILLRGSYEKVLVVGRGLIVKNASGSNLIFDYAGVTYPEGLVGDHVAYFNHVDVEKVVFQGFSDEADTITVDNINRFIAEHPEIERGSVNNWD